MVLLYRAFFIFWDKMIIIFVDLVRGLQILGSVVCLSPYAIAIP